MLQFKDYLTGEYDLFNIFVPVTNFQNSQFASCTSNKQKNNQQLINGGGNVMAFSFFLKILLVLVK